jgi:hypothetical protein
MRFAHIRKGEFNPAREMRGPQMTPAKKDSD